MTAGQTYLASGLGTTVNPVFQGGTLQTDQNNGAYSQDFTLDGSGTNTIDQTGNASTFSGVFSDATPGTPGSIIIANSGVGGSVTFTGVNTYTGATTIDTGATLALAGLGSIATSSGVVDNGALDISGASAGATINTLSGSGAVALGGQGLTLANASGAFGGVISDGGVAGGTGGSLTIAGGSETLSGANTYTGATTIDSGATLALSGSGSIGSSSGVVANGTLDISGASTGATINTLSGSGAVALGGQGLTLANASGAFGGVISDGGVAGGIGGSLTIAGGTEILTGANTYTGATTIDSGSTLYLGYNTAGGSVAGDIVDNGALVFDRDTAAMYAGAVSGAGGVVVSGQSTLTLTGASTYAGGTTVTSGSTLQLGNGGTSGSIEGNVDDNGALVFDRADTVTFAGAISGDGTLTQAGTGTTILDGANSFTGPTTISTGTLEVGDAAHPSATLAGNVVVGASGTLAGHGTIAGSVTNTAGGVVSPGDRSTGTLSVGSYAQGSNSTLAIQVSPTSASELNAAGAVTLNGKLALTFDPGVYSTHVYPIVSGASVSGTFSSVTAGGSIPADGLVYGLTYGGKQTDLVLESTSGAQIYGGVDTATLDQAQGFASLVEDRFGDAGCADGSTERTDSRQRGCDGLGAWAQAMATTDSVGGSAASFGFTDTGGGAMGGLDRRWANGDTVGAAFGYRAERPVDGRGLGHGLRRLLLRRRLRPLDRRPGPGSTARASTCTATGR